MQIAEYIPQSVNNGEGLRCVVFFQGCPFRCKGCHNEELQEFKSGSKTISEIIQHVEENKDFLDGITLSGGEPLAQPLGELLEFIKIMKYRYGMNIWLYTGYSLEEYLGKLSDDKVSQHIFPTGNRTLMEILEEVDVVIEGEYMEDLEPAEFRGSSNQIRRNLNKWT